MKKWISMTVLVGMIAACVINESCGALAAGNDRVENQSLTAADAESGTNQNRQENHNQEESNDPQESNNPQENYGRQEQERTEVPHLWIDSEHVYEGMTASFSSGYVPMVTEKSLNVVIPFLSDADIQEDTITVEADVSGAVSCGITAKNYIKKVRKNNHKVENGTEKEAWLYDCTFALEKQREGGNGTILLNASAICEDGQEISLSYTVFAVLERTVKEEPEKESEKEQERESEKEQEKEAEKTWETEVDESADESITGNEESKPEVVHQPKLILESCNLFNEKLTAGKTYMLSAVFKNCSSKRAIKNMKVTFSSSNENLVIEKPSVYVESVSAGENFTVKKQIQTNAAMEQGNYLIMAGFEYDDADGTTYTAVENIPLAVTQTLSMDMDEVVLPESVYSTETITLPVSVINSSRAPVYNVTVTMDCDGLVPVQSVFLGNMEAGTQLQNEMQVYISSLSGGEPYGLTTGYTKMTYQDAYGNSYEQKLSVTTTIKKPEILELDIEETEPETNGWIWMAAVLLFVIMAGSIVWLVIQLRKKDSI